MWGGRGITVHEEWRSDYLAFKTYVLSELGERPAKGYSFDRINNELGYVPGNVRWADQKTQANNTKRNRVISFKGETHTLAQWAERIGVNYFTLHTRIYRKGWSVERAFSKP
jgi:hypothetical protein